MSYISPRPEQSDEQENDLLSALNGLPVNGAYAIVKTGATTLGQVAIGGSEADTLQTVTDRGATTTQDITVNSLTETVPTLFKLDQTTPQTIANGVPLMTANVDLNGNKSQLINLEALDMAIAAINTNYYMLDSASGVSDYKDTQIAIPALAQASVTDTVTATDQYLQGWISPTGGTPMTLITGIYDIHIHAKVNQTTGFKRVKLYWKMYEYKADTSEVLIGTSEADGELTTVEDAYEIHLALTSDYTVTAGSRIVGKLYADLSGTGSNPDVTLYYQGTEISPCSSLLIKGRHI